MAGKKLQGQVAIVTGAGRGIGAAAARRLARGGATVVLAARTEEEVEAVAAELRTQGSRAIAVAADVSDLTGVEEIVESALEQFDRVDILVNSAGVIWPLEEIAEVDPEEWAYNVMINLVGPFFMVRNVLPVMLDQGYGRILNISSGAATTPILGASAYCTAKAGLDMFTRTLALELQGSKVTANLLYPGHVDTAMQEDIRSVDTTDTRLDTTFWHDLHARGGLQTPAATADLIYWLAGPWSRGHNGAAFGADDGEWLAQVQRDLAG
jgi:NAD(P)-dependent dehydrogenase (short-subunit alcohol dehydrogenase family)